MQLAEIGKRRLMHLDEFTEGVDSARLIEVNAAIRSDPVEEIGGVSRGHMSDMKRIV